MLIDQYDAGFWVAGYTAVAVVGLLIPIRRDRARMTSEVR
jgi:hypothetical protein